MKCEICGGEMGTGGCWTAYKHPPTVVYPLVSYVPGSVDDFWRTRADRAERQAEALAKALEVIVADCELKGSHPLLSDDAAEVGERFIYANVGERLRAVLAAYREGR